MPYVGNNPASWVDPFGLSHAPAIDWGQVLDTIVNTGKAVLTAAEAALAGALTDAAALVANPVTAAAMIAGGIIFYPVPAGDPDADENAYLLPSFVPPESNTCPLPGVSPEPAIPGSPVWEQKPWVETIPAEETGLQILTVSSDKEVKEVKEQIKSIKKQLENKQLKPKDRKKLQNELKKLQTKLKELLKRPRKDITSPHTDGR